MFFRATCFGARRGISELPPAPEEETKKARVLFVCIMLLFYLQGKTGRPYSKSSPVFLVLFFWHDFSRPSDGQRYTRATRLRKYNRLGAIEFAICISFSLCSFLFHVQHRVGTVLPLDLLRVSGPQSLAFTNEEAQNAKRERDDFQEENSYANSNAWAGGVWGGTDPPSRHWNQPKEESWQ